MISAVSIKSGAGMMVKCVNTEVEMRTIVTSRFELWRQVGP